MQDPGRGVHRGSRRCCPMPRMICRRQRQPGMPPAGSNRSRFVLLMAVRFGGDIGDRSSPALATRGSSVSMNSKDPASSSPGPEAGSRSTRSRPRAPRCLARSRRLAREADAAEACACHFSRKSLVGDLIGLAPLVSDLLGLHTAGEIGAAGDAFVVVAWEEGGRSPPGRDPAGSAPGPRLRSAPG